MRLRHAAFVVDAAGVGAKRKRFADTAAVMDRQGAPGVRFDVEGSGYGFRPIRQIPPQQAEMPHRCAMVRP